jgi:SAM-dependent methyltransferase
MSTCTNYQIRAQSKRCGDSPDLSDSLVTRWYEVLQRSELAVLHSPKVLDVGSGPGFLAERVLTGCDVTSYHLFDFSPHMLELSRARLGDSGNKAVFHQGSFLDDGWWQSLPAPFDAIVSMQAIHEARDGARIPKLYDELRILLREGGVILIADEVNDGDKRENHLLSLTEHETALLRAGFEEIRPGARSRRPGLVCGHAPRQRERLGKQQVRV